LPLDSWRSRVASSGPGRVDGDHRLRPRRFRSKPALLPPDLLRKRPVARIAVSELPSGDVLSCFSGWRQARASGMKRRRAEPDSQFAASFYQPGVRLGIKTLHIDTPPRPHAGGRGGWTTRRRGAASPVRHASRPRAPQAMKPAPGQDRRGYPEPAAGLPCFRPCGSPGKDEGRSGHSDLQASVDAMQGARSRAT